MAQERAGSLEELEKAKREAERRRREAPRRGYLDDVGRGGEGNGGGGR